MQYTIQGYFDYIKERQKIYKLKSSGAKSPWTDDLILQKYKFCNVYRHLDAGTQWYMQNIGRFQKAESPAIALWKTILYRTINNPKFFEFAGFPQPNEPSEIQEHIQKAREWIIKGNHFRSDAYLILYPPKYGHSKVEQYGKAIMKLSNELTHITESVLDSKTAKEAWQELQAADGVGPFIAYEIWCDLVLCGYLKWTEDDFVNVGPGAKAPLTALYPGINEQLAMKALQAKQNQYLSGMKYLTLRSIEHNLCEYRKYVNLSNGKGKKRHFNPNL